MTLDEAKTLKIGDRVYVVGENRKNGQPRMWRVAGKTKLWKTMPNRISIPVKYGLREWGHITEDNLAITQKA